MISRFPTTWHFLGSWGPCRSQVDLKGFAGDLRDAMPKKRSIESSVEVGMAKLAEFGWNVTANWRKGCWLRTKSNVTTYQHRKKLLMKWLRQKGWNVWCSKDFLVSIYDNVLIWIWRRWTSLLVTSHRYRGKLQMKIKIDVPCKTWWFSLFVLNDQRAIPDPF